MAIEKNYYQILKVTKDAPEREIKRAYHNLARKLHPDKASSDEEQQRFEEEFALISKAYNVLKDSSKRKEYNAALKEEMKRRQNAALNGKPEGGASPGAHAKGSGQAMDAGRANIAQKAYVKGLQLLQANEYARAVEFFEAAIKNNGNEAMYFAKLAIALMLARRSFTRAVECAQKACELDSFNVDHKLTLAEVYETAGSRSLAIKQLREVLKWDGNNTKAQMRLNALTHPEKPSLFSKILERFRK